MGSKISKNSRSGNDLPEVHSAIAYRFLDTSKIQSSEEPNMMKIFLRPPLNDLLQGQLLFGSGSTSSLAFLRDETYLLFGELSSGAFNTDIDTLYFGVQTANALPAFNDNLCVIDLQLDALQVLFNHSVRDISVSCNAHCEHVAFVTFLGFSHLQLWQFNKESNSLIDKVKEQSMVSHATCCSFSPNGKWLVLAICSNFFTTRNENHLDIFTTSRNKLQNKQKTCFGQKNIGEITVCLEFTSDSKFLAAGSFATVEGRVYLLSTKTWQVILHIEEDIPLHCIIWGAFNTCSMLHQLITSTDSGYLKKWDISSIYNDQTHPKLELNDTSNITDGRLVPTRITSCPKFSPDGRIFAIPLLDGDVIVLDPNLFKTLWIITCPDFQVEFPQAYNWSEALAATSVCFSNSCEYLAIGYSGHVASVWLLPRLHFTLKHFCRTKIISMCPPNVVHKLPIPNDLKKYLLYQL